MSNGDAEARVAAAVEAWQAADWPEAARRAQHALAVGAPVPLLHVLMSSLLRTGDAKQAHRIGESLVRTASF